MVKKDIQEKVYQELGVRREDIKTVTNCFLKHLGEALKTQDKVKVDGIGVFRAENKPARQKPGFGQVWDIGPSRVIRFTPAKPLTRIDE